MPASGGTSRASPIPRSCCLRSNFGPAARSAPDDRGAIAPRQERLRHEQQRSAQRRPACGPVRRQVGAAVGWQLLPHRNRRGRRFGTRFWRSPISSISSSRWRARSRTATCWRPAIGQAISTSRKSCSAATRARNSTPSMCMAAGRRYRCSGASGCLADGTSGRLSLGIQPSPTCRRRLINSGAVAGSIGWNRASRRWKATTARRAGTADMRARTVSWRCWTGWTNNACAGASTPRG